jgi:hypothetical protein
LEKHVSKPQGRWPPAIAILWAVTACAGALAAGCSSEDVTGEPEDIETLVQVVPEGSRCVHDREADDARFEVNLRNTGEDERTVTVTPVRRFSDGDQVGSSIEGFKVTVPGNGEARGGILVDDVSDGLTACLIRLDGGDAIEVDLQEGDA